MHKRWPKTKPREWGALRKFETNLGLKGEVVTVCRNPWNDMKLIAPIPQLYCRQPGVVIVHLQLTCNCKRNKFCAPRSNVGKTKTSKGSLHTLLTARLAVHSALILLHVQMSSVFFWLSKLLCREPIQNPNVTVLRDHDWNVKNIQCL